MKTVLDRFLSYIALDTTSQEEETACPTCPNQLLLGQELVRELQALGLQEVEQDEFGYVMATVPATAQGAPVLGLLAHMDTSAAVSGAHIQPRLVRYTGGDVCLNEARGIWMREEDFPYLQDCRGCTLITSDGTTLLGADDKAGVAEIVTLAARLMAPDAPPHGKLRIAFTPDEEISRGTLHFDVARFGADVAYTVDGGPLGELEYENFNAATAQVSIRGRSIHPGGAKGKMVNAAVVACELQALLPPLEQPAFTEGYQGFYHLLQLQGSVEQASLRYALREHDDEKFREQKRTLQAAAEALNGRWGAGTVSVEFRDQYRNMRSVIQEHMELVDRAKEAFSACGVTPRVQPIRGGTDGARLSFLGLPCPNLSTGGYNFHSCCEFIPLESMEKMVEVLTALTVSFVPAEQRGGADHV